MTMDATEIGPLTEEAVTQLLVNRDRRRSDKPREEKRKHPRWPFPGQIQLWFVDRNGDESIDFATCVDLSPRGLGMLYDESLPVGTELTLTVHQPEASLHGRAVVRHCSDVCEGHYIGVEFIFDGR